MGWSSSGGPKGLGTFNNTPGTVSDFNKARDLVALMGNYRGAVTETERDAITGDSLYAGLMVNNTTQGTLEMYDGSGWEAVWDADIASDSAAVPLTNTGGTTFINQTYTLTVRGRGGLVTLHGRVSRSAGSGNLVGVVPAGFRPAHDVVDVISSVAPASTLGPTFAVGVSASTGEITVTSLGGGSGTWNSGIWIVLNTPWVR
jgi:hypothetical protein